MFTVLPFGLSSAPYIFTKIVRPLTKHWRAQGICITIFLDDGLDIEPSLEIARKHAQAIRLDMLSSGFVLNDDKSIWDPVPVICWLGLSWNEESAEIAIASHRIYKLSTDLTEVLRKNAITARGLAKIVGQIISTSAVTGNLARILSRHCQMSVASANTWDTPFVLDEYCVFELRFWQENLDRVNVRVYDESGHTNKIIFSDASNRAAQH